MPKRIPIVYNGVSYRSFNLFCAEHGLFQSNTYIRFFKLGWSLGECVRGRRRYRYKLCRYCYSMFIPKRSTRLYCSDECFKLYWKRIRGKCEQCGAAIFYSKSEPKRFCGNSCASRYKGIKRGKWVGLVRLECAHCGKSFERPPSRVGTHQKLFFCSQECNTAYSKKKYTIGNGSHKKRHGLKSDLRFSILMRDNFRCRYCGACADDGVRLEVDHIMPRCHGGSDDESNLTTSCAPCNQGKGARIINHDQETTHKVLH